MLPAKVMFLLMVVGLSVLQCCSAAPPSREAWQELETADNEVLGSSSQRVSFKTFLKMLYRLLDKNKKEKEVDSSSEEGLGADSEFESTTVITDEVYFSSASGLPLDDLDGLEDDIADSLYLVAKREADKSQKFTHSFRFGFPA